MNLPAIKMPFRGPGKGAGLEGMPPPAPRVEAPPIAATPVFDAQRQATRDLIGRVQAVAGDQGEEAGLASIASEPSPPTITPAPEAALGIVPKGPARWEGSPRTSVDSTAIDDMGQASAQHAQEQGMTGNEVVTPPQSQMAKPIENIAAAPAAPPLGREVAGPNASDGAVKPEARYAPIIPEAAKPDLTFGRGAVVAAPNTSGATAAAMEVQTGPSPFKGQSEEGQQAIQPPLPDMADIARRVAPLFTKDAESYAAMEPKARAEYLTQALNTCLENPSAIKLSNEEYAALAGKMIGEGEVSQLETVRYAIDTTLRLITDKNGSVKKQLFTVLDKHPELQFLIAKTIDKMGLDIDLKEKKAMMSASETSKGLFLMILMLVLTMAKEIAVSGFSDQRR